MDDRPFDVTLIGSDDGIRVEAHKSVLCATSAFFKGMFTNVMAESSSNEVRLRQFDGATLKPIVDFIYTGTIVLTPDTVEAILTAADFLQLSVLKAECCAYMGKELEPSNCIGVSLYAKEHTCPELQKRAYEFALINFEKVWIEREFLQLDAEQLEKFLSSDDLCTNSEEHVFLSIVKWIDHDRPIREKYMRSLLNSVRYTLLDPVFIINNRASICKSVEFYELICTWLQWHLSFETRVNFPEPKFRPRKKNHTLAFLCGEYSRNLKMQTFDPLINRWVWQHLPAPPKDRTKYSTIIVNNMLIIVGGLIDGVETKSVEYLDLDTRVWSDLPSLDYERCYPALAELEGELYVIGGQKNKRWVRIVEKFNFATREWKTMASFRYRFSAIRVTVHGRFLFIVGCEFSAMECYDPIVNTWIQRKYKTEKTLYFGFASFGQYIYAVGGIHDNQTHAVRCVERYDPSSNTWSYVSSLRIEREEIRCCAYKNKLILCGGFVDDICMDTTESYDPELDEWHPIPALLRHEPGYEHTNLLTF